jgi:hypothetical protein
MVAHDDQAAAGQSTGSRRAFLRGTGLAALASAGALAIPSTSALAAPGRASGALAPLASSGLVPPDAALTLRIFRSLTLLTMAATLRDRAFGARVQDAALKDLGRQVGTLGGQGSASYDPETDGICPPWWPWPFPWPPRRFDDVFDVGDPAIPKAGLIAIDMFRTLSLYNMAFQFSDQGMRIGMQKLAVEELQAQYGSLRQGGSLAGYDDGDGICPDWWPWPWPRPHAEVAGIPTPQPARVLLDLARSLVSHNIAMRFTDSSAQQRSVGQARQQIQGLAKTMGGFAGGAAAWEPGDDICPPWWPWPWPGPHRLGDILDPAAMGDPEPQPNSAIQVTLDMFRSSTVFALAAQIDDQGLALGLQTQAIGELNAQAQQL